jgi:hypothetical protein
MYGRIQNEAELFNYFGGRDATGDYFEHLFAESEKHAGVIKGFLLNYKISDEFKASGRAPDTSSRQAMIQATISPEQCTVEDLINKHECSVVNGRILDVTWLNELCVIDGDLLPQTRTLAHILSDIGYQQIEGRRVFVKKTDKRHYVWFKPSQKTDSDIAKNEVVDFFKKGLAEIPF